MPTNNQFSINLPEGWIDTTTFTFQGPLDSGVQHNLVVIVDPSEKKDIDLKAYATRQLDTSKIALPGFELISEKEKNLSPEVEAYEIVYKYIPADEVIIFQKQVILLIDGKGYLFTASFSKKTLKTIASEVDKIIASFVPGINYNDE